MHAMAKYFRAAVLISFVLCPIALLAQASDKLVQEQKINQIITETSIPQQLEQSVTDLERQFDQNPFGLPDSLNKQMMQAFSDNFSPETLTKTLQKVFDQQYDPTHADSTIQWLNKSSVQSVLDYEKEFYTLQGIRKRVVNKYELEQNPPSRERGRIIAELVTNSLSADREIETRATIFRALISALNDLSTQRSFTQQQIDIFVDNYRSQIRSQIDQELTNQLLVKYHGLDNKALENFMTFYKTGSGNWLNTTTSEAVDSSLKKASEEFLNSVRNLN
jgi:hypothetical protein